MAEPKLTDTTMRPVTLTQRTGMSIALVVVIVAGIVSNVSMMFALRSDVALVQKDVTHVVDDVGEIRTALAGLSEETHRETTSLRVQLSTLQAQFTDLASRIRELEK
tara:strand:+ start:34808 stop:35128 length:321 start_codon:yes stop_codon:yes gene_type:complete